MTVLRASRPPRWDERDASSPFFVGGISPLWLFDWQLERLFSVVELARAQARTDHLYEDTLRHASEVALVGALGYFEAFCKHQFAALLTLHPTLLVDFASRRPASSMPLSVLASAPGALDASVGFLVAETHDFGSAKRINCLFGDLLQVSAFSKDEGDELDAILRRRHLLVHHGGILTAASAARRAPDTSGEPFRDVVSVEADEYFEIQDFLLQLAVKTATTTVRALKARTQNLADLTPERQSGVEFLLRGVWDLLEA
jgi:hypothetical protein